MPSVEVKNKCGASQDEDEEEDELPPMVSSSDEEEEEMGEGSGFIPGE